MKNVHKSNEKPVETVKQEDYTLKTEAVDKLTKSLKEGAYEEIPQTDKEKGLDPYKVDKLSRIPTWIKVFFVKFWVAGAICYFFLWGLGNYITNNLDMLVMLGIALGIITDVFVNSAFLHFESDKKEYHKYMIVPVSCKKVWTLLINIPLGIIEMYLVYYFYVLTNYLWALINNLPMDTITINVEPLLFGLFYLIIDLIFLGIKNLIVGMVRNIKNNIK